MALSVSIAFFVFVFAIKSRRCVSKHLPVSCFLTIRLKDFTFLLTKVEPKKGNPKFDLFIYACTLVNSIIWRLLIISHDLVWVFFCTFDPVVGVILWYYWWHEDFFHSIPILSCIILIRLQEIRASKNGCVNEYVTLW